MADDVELVPDGKQEADAAAQPPAPPPPEAMRVFTGGNQPQKRAQADCKRDAGERLWAREYESGARYYVCATQAVMYAFVSQKPNQDLYEIIEAPAAVQDESLRFRTQSRLYLDVEFKRAINPKAPADEDIVPPLVESLVAYAKKALPLVDRADVMRFSAHSERKFSEHVCIRLFDKEGVELWFEANWHAGALVRRWELDVARTAFPSHYMNSDSKTSDIDFVVDKGVYTRNRIFRTGSATKRGETRMLVKVDAPAGEWRMSYDEWRDALAQDHDRAESAKHVMRLLEASGAPASSLAIFYSPEDLVLGADAAVAAAPVTRKRRLMSSGSSSGGLVVGGDLFPEQESGTKRARTTGTLAGAFVAWIQRRHPHNLVELRIVSERSLVIHTDCHECPIAGRAHKSNVIYYVLDDLGADYGDMARLRCRLRCRDANCPPPQTQIEIPRDLCLQYVRAAQLMQIMQDDVQERSRFSFSAGF